jgi:hypothetical protein
MNARDRAERSQIGLIAEYSGEVPLFASAALLKAVTTTRFGGGNAQGATLEEARANLQEAVTLVLEANRDLIGETTHGGDVIREVLKVGA